MAVRTSEEVHVDSQLIQKNPWSYQHSQQSLAATQDSLPWSPGLALAIQDQGSH